VPFPPPSSQDAYWIIFSMFSASYKKEELERSQELSKDYKIRIHEHL
jgi:hypothetical protein